VNAHSTDTAANQQIRKRREDATGIQAARRSEDGPSIIVLRRASIIVIALSRPTMEVSYIALLILNYLISELVTSIGLRCPARCRDLLAEHGHCYSRQQLWNWKTGKRRVREHVELILTNERKARKSAS
jgi:hypothetical protein